MDRLIFHNERIVALDESRLSPGQMGLLAGWGVFTTLRIYRGVPFAFERHWARLSRDAALLGVNLSFAQETVRQAVVDLAGANRRSKGMARVAFVKNEGGLWAAAEGHPPTDLLVFTREIVPWPASHRLTLRSGGTFSASPFAGTKMLSWAIYSAIHAEARAQGFDEALLLNEKGQLAECTSANFFLVRGQRVLTPPLSSGCLPGVTREILLEIAPASGIEMREQDLAPDDIGSAEETFISSTTREVAGVGSIDDRWKSPAPGKVALRLEKAFQDYVQSHIPHP